MKPKWLICNLGKDEHIQSLYYGALENDIPVEVLSLKEFAELLEPDNDEKACVITMGSIWLNTYARERRPNWFGCFHDKKTFLCSTYYKHWGQYITQKDYFFCTLDELRGTWGFTKPRFKGEDPKFFVRPDSGEKEFVGEVVRVKDFDIWYKRVTEVYSVKPDEKIVVSQVVDIDKELRLVIADKKVIDGSVYKAGNHLWMSNLNDQDDKDEIIAFAEKVLNDNPPPLPPYHVLDIAVHPDKSMTVMEVGCFCCCGLYDCDRRKIVPIISDVAEREYGKLEINV